MKQTLLYIKGQISPDIIVDTFNTPLSSIERKSKQKYQERKKLQR
jgi:hypothetical protein